MTTTILQPRVSLALASAEREVSNAAQKVLLCGQSNVAATGVLVENVSNNNVTNSALFGANSQIAEMIRAFKEANELVELDVLPIEDNAGATAREVLVTYVGDATSAATMTIVVGSEVNHTITFAVTGSVAVPMTVTQIASAAKAAVNLDTEAPFLADSAAGVLTLTAVNEGIVANDLGVEVSGSYTGQVSQVITEPTPGAVDPDTDGLLDVATDRYQGIVWPWTDTSDVEAYLLPRFAADNEVLDGVAFGGFVGSAAGAVAYTVQNDHNLVIFCDKVVAEDNYIGPAQNEASYVKSAIFAAIRAIRLTPDASIGRFLVSSASRDQFGGPALASLPYFNTVLSQLPGIDAGRGFTDLEIEQILAGGGSVMGVNSNNTSGLQGEVSTTYLTDAAANPDVTWTFLNYVDTSSNIREYFFNNYRNRFSQSRLTEGNLSRGRDVANELSIRAYTEQLYQDLSSVDFILVQSGEDAFNFFKQNLDVELDLALGKVTITMFVPLVTQLRTILGTIKIAFSTS
jgi:phage tail sheath gpL-like